MTKVIKAKAKDFEGFYKLLKKTLQDGSFLYPKESISYLINIGLPKKAQLKKDILKGERPLYIVYKKDKIVGYLLTKKEYAGVAFGHWLGVDSKFRHKGIGSELLINWEKDAIKMGAHVLQLWTTENDLGFYKKNRFILGGKFEKAWFGLNHYLFYKIIGKPNPKKYVNPGNSPQKRVKFA